MTGYWLWWMQRHRQCFSQEEEAVASVVVLRDGQEPVERPGDRPGGVPASSRIR